MDYKIFGGEYSFHSYHPNNFQNLILMDVSTHLGSPDDVYDTAFNLGFPQVLAFGTAAIGIIITGMIVNALRG